MVVSHLLVVPKRSPISTAPPCGRNRPLVDALRKLMGCRLIVVLGVVWYGNLENRVVQSRKKTAMSCSGVRLQQKGQM